VPLRIILALLLAFLLTKPYRGANAFRVLFYLPGIISGVAVAVIWLRMFDPFYGIINDVLGIFGLPKAPWINDARWAMPSLILMNIMYIGSPMVVFIAGLKDIPVQLYEVSKIDGAGPITRFIKITLPMLSPVLFFNLIMQIISSFQVFTNAYVMTSGGPVKATLVYVLYIYQTAFQWLRMGYGSALAWVLFCIIGVMTLIIFKTSGWVYFESKGEGQKW
jgi:multiple sugar transport system permease protein